MIYYARVTPKNTKGKIEEKYSKIGVTSSQIIFDNEKRQKQDDSLYMSIKQRLLSDKTAIMVDSVTSLGKNSREIYKEVSWFYDNDIRLYVLDMDFISDEPVDPDAALLRIFRQLALTETQNAKAAQRIGIDRALTEEKSYGRQKLPYPDDWDENYKLWENGDITAKEFMDRTGLKKGTFYNMVKDYKTGSSGIVTKRA